MPYFFNPNKGVSIEIIPNETITDHLKRIRNIDKEKLEKLVQISDDNKTLGFEIPLNNGKYLEHSIEAGKCIKVQDILKIPFVLFPIFI